MIHHSENSLVMLDSVPSMNELVSLFMKINEFSTSINHTFSFSGNHKSGHLITFCWAQDVTVVVVNVCGLSQLCHFTADTFCRCLRCLKQHQAHLVNIPDMYLLSTLDDTIDISWFNNCYHKKNNVCFICFNIPKY